MSKSYCFWVGFNGALGVSYFAGHSEWGWVNALMAVAMLLVAAIVPR